MWLLLSLRLCSSYLQGSWLKSGSRPTLRSFLFGHLLSLSSFLLPLAYLILKISGFFLRVNLHFFNVSIFFLLKCTCSVLHSLMSFKTTYSCKLDLSSCFQVNLYDSHRAGYSSLTSFSSQVCALGARFLQTASPWSPCQLTLDRVCQWKAQAGNWKAGGEAGERVGHVSSLLLRCTSLCFWQSLSVSWSRAHSAASPSWLAHIGLQWNHFLSLFLSLRVKMTSHLAESGCTSFYLLPYPLLVVPSRKFTTQSPVLTLEFMSFSIIALQSGFRCSQLCMSLSVLLHSEGLSQSHSPFPPQ